MTPSREAVEAVITDALQEVKVSEERLERAEADLASAKALLAEVADELARWGMGDIHYGARSQPPRVADLVAKCRAFLAGEGPMSSWENA